MADDIARLGYEIDSTQARTAAGDLDKLNAASVRVAKGYDSLSNASRNLLRDEKGKFMGAQAAAAKYASEIDMLRSKYNPLYSASKQLAAGQNEIRRALELGAISARQANAAMDALQAKYISTSAAARQMGNVQASVGNQFAQMNDVVVTSIGGMNPALIGFQQGMQMVQGFAGQSVPQALKTLGGAFATLFSPLTLLTIGVVAGTAALVQWGMSAIGASEDADKLAEKVTDIATAANSYKSAIDAASISTVDLVSKFGMQAEQMQRLYDLNVALQRIQLQQKIQEFSSAASAQYSGLANQLEKIVSLSKAAADSTLSQSSAQDLLNKSVANLRNEYGLGVGQALALSAAIDEIGQADTMDKQAAAAQRFGEELVKASDGGAKIPPEMVRLAIEAGVAADTIRQLEGALLDAASAASSISIPGGGGGRGDPRQFSMSDEFRAQLASQDAWKAPTKPKGRKKGGGGKSAAEKLQDDMQKRYEVLSEGFKSESALAMSNYAKDLETLKWALEQKKLTQSEYKVAQDILRIETWGSEFEQQQLQYQLEQDALAAALEKKYITEKEYQQRIAAIKTAERNVTLMQTAGLFGSLQQMAQAGGAKLAKTAAIFGGIQATIASYVAATKAMAETPGSMFTRIAAYASVLATGLGAVAAIKSAGGGGSGGGVSSAPASATGTTQQAQPERRVMVSLDGPDWVKNIIEPIMTQIYEQTGDGTKVIFSK